MTTQVDLAEAQARLCELLDRAADGEDIIITQGGRPRVRLVAVPASHEPRRFGALQGQITFHRGWDEDLTEDFECLQDTEPSEPHG